MDQAEKDPAQVLEDAADLLLIHGRSVGHGRYMRTGTYCTLGAIAEVVEPGWWNVEQHGSLAESRYWLVCEEGVPAAAVAAIAGRIRTTSAMPALSVSDWNDSTSDDFEVIDTLRLVAKSLRNGE